MDGWVTVGTKLDTKDFDAQIKEVEYELKQLEYELSRKKELNLDSRTVSEYESRAEKLNNRLIDLRKKQEDLNKTNLTKAQQNIEKLGNSTSKVITKISKWVLAIFSVRSAYMGIRNAMSILTQYNDDLANKLESIKLVFASALEPLITRIVNLVYSLLGAINSIAKAWFNVDLFASASAKAIKSGAGSAEKMRKSLAGFDEMNVITDTSTSGGGISSPTVDFSDVGNTDLSGIYKLTDKIKKIFDKVFTQIKQNVMKVMLDLGFSRRFIDMWDMMVEGVRSIIKGLLDFIGGILGTIIALVTGNTEKVKENINRAIKGIGEIIAGLLSLIIGIFGQIIAVIIDAFLVIGKLFNGLWNGIVDGFNIAVNWIKNTFNSMVNFFRNIINTIVGLFKNIGTKVGDAIGGAFKTVVNGVLKAIESILNSPIRAVNSLIKTINKVPGINISKLPTFSLPRLAVGGVVNMPGRGINYGGANIGERGAEGVIPLTNSQMMAQLGEAIGKYVNINATVPVYVGNRQIAREIKKISADNDFAFNR